MKRIGNSAFSSTGIQEVIIPKSVESIGESAFSGCSKLNSLIFEENIELKTIEKRTFFGTKIQEVIISKSVESIGKSAFCGCFMLNSLIFEDGSRLRIIGKSAFQQSGLVNLVLPSELEVIGIDAFRAINSFESVVIPTKTTAIYSYAFGNNTNLIIYTYFSSKPTSWENTYNYSIKATYWQGQWYFDGDGNPIKK